MTDFPGPHPDARCCGDHPGDWERPAEPGHSFCRDCLDRLLSPWRLYTEWRIEQRARTTDPGAP